MLQSSKSVSDYAVALKSTNHSKYPAGMLTSLQKVDKSRPLNCIVRIEKKGSGCMSKCGAIGLLGSFCCSVSQDKFGPL